MGEGTRRKRGAEMRDGAGMGKDGSLQGFPLFSLPSERPCAVREAWLSLMGLPSCYRFYVLSQWLPCKWGLEKTEGQMVEARAFLVQESRKQTPLEAITGGQDFLLHTWIEKVVVGSQRLGGRPLAHQGPGHC